MRQAAEWFAVLGSGDADLEMHRRWQAWVEASTEHRRAWQQVEAISGQFALPAKERPAAAAALDAAFDATRHALHRRRALKTLALLGMSASVGWAAWTSPQYRSLLVAAARGFGADYRTGTGETAEFPLPDGGRLWLDTASAADAEYGPALRRIALHRGRVLVDSAPDTISPARPLVVDTAEGRLRALGTRFAVRQLDDATEIAVFAGRVEVHPAQAEAGTHIVAAGQQLRFTSGTIGAPQAADAAREAWTRGVLLADNLPLAQVVAEIACYRRGLLQCDPAVADLRVAGGYPLLDSDRALAMLEAALPVRARRRLPGWTVVELR
ncbi:hypothetical protein BA022_08815 [Diaphorobacter nitroreducens]|nr:hypothetical protein BA022_08815 [Diaphorobacter nitroreducens]